MNSPSKRMSRLKHQLAQSAGQSEKPVTLSRPPWEPALVISGGRAHGPKSDKFQETVRRFNERD